MVGLRLLDAELFPRVRAEAFGRPRRSPDNIDSAIADAGQLLEAGFNLRADIDVFGATLGGKGHLDSNVLLLVFRRREIHFVNQTEIDNIDRDFRIIATPERTQDILFGDGWHRNSLIH
jgi:hypothetical protein